MRGITTPGLTAWWMTLVFVTICVSGCQKDTRQPAHQGGEATSAFARELDELEMQIAALAARAEAQVTSWTATEQLALAWMRRGGLSGDLNDYVHAQAALDEAFRRAPAGAGPFLARAELHFTLHELDRVEPDLLRAERAVLVDVRQCARIVGLRADVHFQSGRFAPALAGFRHALELHPSVEAYARLAHYHAATGNVAEAERHFAQAEALLRGASRRRAWLHLQLGLVDLAHGRTRAAMAHYRDAEAHFDGWWLVEEHMAEIYALHGDEERARSLYVELVQRTGNPELMGRLAALVPGTERARWIDQATREHRARMQIFEAAALGHALEHFLEFGTDATEAVRLAERNHTFRPGAQASIQLAVAYLAAGQTQRAHVALQPVLHSPFVSAELYVTAAAIAAAEGRQTEARAYRVRARALNPRLVDSEVALSP